MPEPQELIALLSLVHENLISMTDLLDQEAKCLQSRDIESIEDAARRKRELADYLNDLTAKQRNLLELLGYSADRAGMENFLDQVSSEPDGTEIRDIWQSLLKVTAECRHQNEINGAYLGLLERYVESSLDLISGSPSQSETYGPKGSKNRGVLSRRSFKV